MTELVQHPGDFVGQEHEVTGFAYQTEGGEWVLASEPNLRSCCIKKGRPMVIKGELPEVSSSSPVKIKGRILQEEGGLVLVDPEILAQSKGFPFWVMGLVLVGGLIALRRR